MKRDEKFRPYIYQMQSTVQNPVGNLDALLKVKQNLVVMLQDRLVTDIVTDLEFQKARFSPECKSK